MPIRRVTPKEAVELVASGWMYIDVRTIPEFDTEHPSGAYNVPLLLQGQAGRSMNPDFVEVIEAALGRDARLVIGCASGNRSRRAADLLAEAGYEDLVDMRAGFGGETDSMGRVIQPGWKAAGLPTESTSEAGHRYEDLVNKARGGES